MIANLSTGSRKNEAQRMRMGLLVAIALMLPHLDALAQSNVNLLTAGNFAVLAGSGITVAGAVNSTTITGDIGTYPTPSITGLGNVVLNGVNHAGDAVTQQAKNDLVTAYNDAAGRAPTTTYPPIQDLGGLILTNGVYYDSSSFAITGTLKLDAGGDPNAVWIFQAGSTLTAETGSSVILTNGAQACNVFWVVGSSATLNTGASFIGTIIALHSITIDTSATLDGRALALNDAVTLDTDAVSLPPCGVSTLAGVPADTSASCDAIPIPATVTASSTCSTQTTPAVLSESFLAGSCAYTYTLLRVWTATNACGDSFSATQSR